MIWPLILCLILLSFGLASKPLVFLFMGYQYQTEIMDFANLACRLPLVPSNQICTFVTAYHGSANLVETGYRGVSQVVAQSAHLIYIQPTLEDARESLDGMYLIIKASVFEKGEELTKNGLLLRNAFGKLTGQLAPFLSDVLGAPDLCAYFSLSRVHPSNTQSVRVITASEHLQWSLEGNSSLLCLVMGDRWSFSSCRESAGKAHYALSHTLRKLGSSLSHLLDEAHRISYTLSDIENLLQKCLDLMGDELEAAKSARMAMHLFPYRSLVESRKQRANATSKLQSIGELARTREEIATCIHRIHADIRQLRRRMEGLREQSTEEGLAEVLSPRALIAAIERGVTRVRDGRSHVERLIVAESTNTNRGE